MSRAAVRYAKAILSLATETDSAKLVNQDMVSIENAVVNNTELNSVLNNPVITSDKKQNILNLIFKNVHPQTKKMFSTLAENKRINLLGPIASKYTQLYDVMRNAKVAKVTTATAITAELETKIIQKISELTTAKAEIQNVIDERILGGFILRIGDLQYDASVANKLNTLKREFTLN